jgi:hypothetical protein
MQSNNNLIQAFNEVQTELTKLTNKQKTIFGFLCCRRQLKYCQELESKTNWKATTALKEILKKAEKNSNPIETLIKKVEQILPSSDEYKIVETNLAQDSIFVF